MKKYNKIYVLLYIVTVIVCLFLIASAMLDFHMLSQTQIQIEQTKKAYLHKFDERSLLFHPLLENKNIDEAYETVVAVLGSSVETNFLGAVRVDSAFNVQNIGVAYAAPDYLLKEDYFDIVEGRMINAENSTEAFIEVLVKKSDSRETSIPMALDAEFTMEFSDRTTDQTKTLNVKIVGFLNENLPYPFHNPLAADFDLVIPDISGITNIKLYPDMYGDMYLTFNSSESKKAAMEELAAYGVCEEHYLTGADILNTKLEEIARVKPIRITLSVVTASITTILLLAACFYLMKKQVTASNKKDTLLAILLPLLSVLLYYILEFILYVLFHSRLLFYPYNFWYGALTLVLLECMNVVYITLKNTRVKNDKN